VARKGKTEQKLGIGFHWIFEGFMPAYLNPARNTFQSQPRW